MSYSPPDSSSVDFELEGYTAPAADQVDFELGDLSTITPPAADLSLSPETPTATVAGTTSLEPPAQSLDLSPGQTSISGIGTVTVAPGAETLSLSDHGASVAYEISPAPVELSFDPLDLQLESSVWIIGGTLVEEIVEETRTWDKLTLTFRAGEQQVNSNFRPLDQEAGKLDILEKSNGGFIALDRVDGDNTYQLTPPRGRRPPRLSGTFFVDEYNEEVVDQQGNEYQVTISFIPDGPRTTDSGYTETVDTGEWEFDFETGTVATRRVNAEVGSSAASGTRNKRLQLILTDQQVQVLEESATRLNAVRVREVPDGKNIAEDNSAGDRNTVTISSPNEQVFESGDYVVQTWETVMQNDDWHRVSVTFKSA